MFPGVFETQEYPLIEEGLPSLNREMIAGEINTPRRIAAFCTTLRFESRFRYNVRQFTCNSTYCGRGFIQLTGSGNYTTAGAYLGIDMIATPDEILAGDLSKPNLALSLDWSAKIANWYWNVNRHCNPLADQLLMGKVNRAIGYPLVVNPTTGKSNDDARCEAFAYALEYLTGEPTPPVDCNR